MQLDWFDVASIDLLHSFNSIMEIDPKLSAALPKLPSDITLLLPFDGELLAVHKYPLAMSSPVLATALSDTDRLNLPPILSNQAWKLVIMSMYSSAENATADALSDASICDVIGISLALQTFKIDPLNVVARRAELRIESEILSGKISHVWAGWMACISILNNHHTDFEGGSFKFVEILECAQRLRNRFETMLQSGRDVNVSISDEMLLAVGVEDFHRLINRHSFGSSAEQARLLLRYLNGETSIQSSDSDADRLFGLALRWSADIPRFDTSLLIALARVAARICLTHHLQLGDSIDSNSTSEIAKSSDKNDGNHSDSVTAMNRIVSVLAQRTRELKPSSLRFVPLGMLVQLFSQANELSTLTVLHHADSFFELLDAVCDERIESIGQPDSKASCLGPSIALLSTIGASRRGVQDSVLIRLLNLRKKDLLTDTQVSVAIHNHVDWSRISFDGLLHLLDDLDAAAANKSECKWLEAVVPLRLIVRAMVLRTQAVTLQQQRAQQQQQQSPPEPKAALPKLEHVTTQAPAMSSQHRLLQALDAKLLQARTGMNTRRQFETPSSLAAQHAALLTIEQYKSNSGTGTERAPLLMSPNVASLLNGSTSVSPQFRSSPTTDSTPPDEYELGNTASTESFSDLIQTRSDNSLVHLVVDMPPIKAIGGGANVRSLLNGTR